VGVSSARRCAQHVAMMMQIRNGARFAAEIPRRSDPHPSPPPEYMERG
jgi:hypothetical protein